MDIRDLRYAVTALDEGSFARAARKLYVSRQALSQSVKRLEAETGTSLFMLHGSNRLTPTPQGRTFLEDARTVVSGFDAFLDRHSIAAPTSQRAQSLSIALATGAALSLGDGFFDAFRTHAPDIAQEVEETNTDGALDLLDNSRADVALVGSYPGYLGSYESALLVATGLWLAVPRANPLSERDAITPADLDGQRIVTAGKLNHLHRYLIEVCERAGARPVIPTTASNPDLLVKMALEYHALFFTFPETVRPSSKHDERAVAVIPFKTPDSSSFGTYLVRTREARRTAAARLFWEYACNRPVRRALSE